MDNIHFPICSCDKVSIEFSTEIQCSDCINGIKTCSRDPDCACVDKTKSIMVCKACTIIRTDIKLLNDELDDLLYHLSYDIRNYKNCDEELARVARISIQLRELNRQLLENL